MKLFFPTMFSGSEWLNDALIDIDKNGIIKSLVSEVKSSDADEVFSGTCLPGMPNLHSHAFQRAMVGLSEISSSGENNFWTWQKVMYEFLTKLSPEDLEAIACQLYVEMLKGGYTSVAEFHYLHNDKNGDRFENPSEMSDRIFAASNQTGIGLTHLPVLYAHGGFGALAPHEGQKRFLQNINQFQFLLEKLKKHYGNDNQRKIGMALHSLRAVSPEMAKDAVALMSEEPIHIHISEQTKEVDQCVDWSGKRPVEWLLENINVDRRWCLIHATHMTDAEIIALAQTHAAVGLCPTTEANLGDGLFSLKKFMCQKGKIGIGSDSNTSVDVAEELRLLEYGQRLTLKRRNIGAISEGDSTGETLFKAALSGGSQALNQPIGSLTPGHRADIIVLNNQHPVLFGRTGSAIIDSWIFTGGRELISDVFVAGQHLVKNHRHIRQEDIERFYLKTIKSLTT
jgi:formimidoylglutamate deiminase